MLGIMKKVREKLVGREEELIAILAALDAGKHILLEGPPGTSKSTLLRSIARAANIPFYVVEGNLDLTPGKLVGYFNPGKVMSDGYKEEFFEKGPLSRAMEEGGILYIEEFNRMPADVSNVLITPMEERELHIPRFGCIYAAPRFTVIASQNPYDDVGTVRVSRAFMDRICLINLEYQSEEEEMEIVRLHSGCNDLNVAKAAVKIVRKTREHSDIKLGASVRAAIDLVDIFLSLQKVNDQPANNLLYAANMALSNKIWLNETTTRTPAKIIEEIYLNLQLQQRINLPAKGDECQAITPQDAGKEVVYKKKNQPN